MEISREFHWKRISGTGATNVIYDRYGSRAVLVGHKIFLVGNNHDRNHIGDVLDLQLRMWRKIPKTRWNLVLRLHTANLYDDKIVLLGVKRSIIGDDYHPTADAFMLDSVTMKVDVLPMYGKKPDFIFQNTADVYEERKQLVLFGGGHVRKGKVDTLRILHLQNMVWQIVDSKGESPPPMYRQGTCIVKHTLFLIGGDSVYGHSHGMFCVRLDQSVYTWHKLKPRGYTAVPRLTPAFLGVGGDRILMFGGYSHGARNDLLVLEDCLSKSPEWFAAQDSNHPGSDASSYVFKGLPPSHRECPCAVRLKDRIIILGGSANDGSNYYELTCS